MYASILLNSNTSQRLGALTYSVPENLRSQIQIGSIVKVPLRNKKYAGLVLDIQKELDKNSKHRLKDIEQIIYSEPLISEKKIKTAYLISNYYFADLYKVLSLFLPDKIWDGKFKMLKENFYKLLITKNEIENFITKNQKKSEKICALLNLFIANEKISETEIKKTYKFSTQIIKKLIEKNFIKLIEGQTLNSIENHHEQKNNFNLSTDQKNAIEIIQTSNKKNFLIHGVTGSGKTEIYLQLAKSAYDNNQQTLILVPEISLTPQFLAYFQKEFGNEIAVLHSKLGELEKCQQWMRILHCEAKIIIGSRSALFCPFQNLKYLIIDEEHSWTYKQENSPKYDARFVAFEMLKLYPNLKLILGSATPSIENYFLAEKNDLQLIKLKTRINEKKLPKTYIIDLRNELRSGNFSIFSNLLQEKIAEKLNRHEQVILFLNRRGSSSSVICRDCGYTCKCKVCEIPLTYHEIRAENFLQCHYCGYTTANPLTCPICKSTRIKYIGIGTQKIEQEIQKLFPTARISRADGDTVSQKHAFQKIYTAMKNHEIDILVGTQMITKGLHLPKVSLVGIILADMSLSIPDFRAQENTFQLLTQVAGRAGREEIPGEVIIQTYIPNDFTINTASKHDYQTFYENEIKNRKNLNFPPFSSLIKLTYTHKDAKICKQEAEEIYQEIQKTKNQENKSYRCSAGASPTIQNLEFKIQNLKFYIAPPIYPRLYGKYHYNIWLKGEYEILRNIIKTLDFKPDWRIDIDPIGI
ncbi:primosomal protein N' [Candidatus Peregrinibacteria bacterium RIFOXYB2_FULL_32_7]|nr:MAG: primosomal protein N' [Candidatus Peregrinibacteria bacterium RIFOXYB2_FULL_32_7]